VPARLPPHKPSGEDPGAAHRLQMCRLALEGIPGLSACAVEIERDGPSYTVDTLTELHDSHPDAELTLILGADIASTLASWREPAKLLELAGLAIAARAGTPPQSVLDAVASVPAGPSASESEASAGASDDVGHQTRHVRFLEMAPVAISSSEVRARVGAGAGEPIEQLVGPKVAAYIAEHGLYREPAEVSP
jgi:nicotinate-nucleotide adenylyltransferase